MSTFRNDLATEAANWRKLGDNPGAWMMQEFVVREGIDGLAQPLPRGFRPDTPKLCFANAARLVRRRKGLRYVEGYCLRHDFPLSFHHAWAMDDRGRVIDVTLREPERYAYLGAVIPPEDYVAQTTKDSASVLDTGCGINAAYILARCPEIAELLSDDLRQRIAA